MAKMAQLNGWISLHRKFLTWQFFDDAEAVKLFVFLLLSAAPKEFTYKGNKIESGQFITSFRELEKSTKISVKKLRILFDRFKENQIIDIQANKHYSIVTILNYKTYQKNGKKTDEIFEEKKGTQNGTQKGTQKDTPKDAQIQGLQEIKGTQNGTQKGTQNDTRINKEENKDFNNNCCCIETTENFEKNLQQYVEEYGQQFCEEFFKWYTKKDSNGKMKFQNLQFTDLKFYLDKWKISTKRISEIKKQNQNKIAPAKNPKNAPVSPELAAAAMQLLTR